MQLTSEGTQASLGAAEPPPADLTVREVGARLGRHPSTVRAWCEAGRFPGAYRFEHREWRCPIAGVLALEEQQRSGGSRSIQTSRRREKGADLGAWRRAAS